MENPEYPVLENPATAHLSAHRAVTPMTPEERVIAAANRRQERLAATNSASASKKRS